MSTMRLAVINHGLMEVPIWNEDRRRGKNWAAVVGIDGTAPGGLTRRFLPYGRGEVFFLVEQVALFDVLEFAADDVAYGGDVTPDRWYGVVVVKTDDFLDVEQVKNAGAAVLLAKSKRTDKAEYLRALEAEKTHLASRTSEIDAEMKRVIEAPEPAPEPLASAPNPLRSIVGPVSSKLARYTYAVHYAGAATWQRGQSRVQVQAGAALCVTTERAVQRIRERGNSTLEHEKVTCSKCRELMALAGQTGSLDPPPTPVDAPVGQPEAPAGLPDAPLESPDAPTESLETPVDTP